MDELETPDIRTARGFLTDREDYFRVFVVKSPVGQGWDVVLRVDGPYEAEAVATDAARRIKRMLLDVGDLDHDRWFSWEP